MPKVRPKRSKATFTCQVCSASFDTKNEFLDHEHKLQKVEGKPFKCESCPSNFSSTLLLKKHVAGVHEEKKTGFV